VGGRSPCTSGAALVAGKEQFPLLPFVGDTKCPTPPVRPQLATVLVMHAIVASDYTVNLLAPDSNPAANHLATWQHHGIKQAGPMQLLVSNGIELYAISSRNPRCPLDRVYSIMQVFGLGLGGAAIANSPPRDGYTLDDLED
jgi:hypothetical protein